VEITEYDRLALFTFEDLTIDTVNSSFDKNLVKGITLKNVRVNNQVIE